MSKSDSRSLDPIADDRVLIKVFEKTAVKDLVTEDSGEPMQPIEEQMLAPLSKDEQELIKLFQEVEDVKETPQPSEIAIEDPVEPTAEDMEPISTVPEKEPYISTKTIEIEALGVPDNKSSPLAPPRVPAPDKKWSPTDISSAIKAVRESVSSEKEKPRFKSQFYNHPSAENE